MRERRDELRGFFPALRFFGSILILAIGLGAHQSWSEGLPETGGEEEAVQSAFATDEADQGRETNLTEAQDAARKRYSPYAGRQFPTRVYFGDTHNHTANSGDAFMGGNRLNPEQAYRLARGEEVISSSGIPLRLSRPLDFLVISDHAEGLGVIDQLYQGNPALDPVRLRAVWDQDGTGGSAEASGTGLVLADLVPAMKNSLKLAPRILSAVVGETRMDATVGVSDAPDETFDIGSEYGSPVVEDDAEALPFRFNGTISKMIVDSK